MFSDNKQRNLLNQAVCLLVLLCFVACNANYKPSFKQSITDSSLRSRVSRVIDAQMDNVKDYLDEDLRGPGSQCWARRKALVRTQSSSPR